MSGDVTTEVVDQRVGVYGDPTETFARIAEVWSGVLGVHVNATDVPLCLIGMKLVRTQVTPDYSDNSDDVAGYLKIFKQIVGEDMVHARTVTEYLEKKKESEGLLPLCTWCLEPRHLHSPEMRECTREGYRDGHWQTS